MQEISVTTFLTVPLTVMLAVAILNIYFGFAGKFHPWQIMLRALGGAMYLFGFGLLMMSDMDLTKPSVTCLAWGVMTMSIPRLLFLAQQVKVDVQDTKRWESSKGSSE